MDKLITQATEEGGTLRITVSTETDPLFSFSVKWFSSPFLIEGGVKFLHVDALKWHSEAARLKCKFNTIGYSRGDPAPIVLMENPELENISKDEIENLYEIVRYGRRAWPIGWAGIWVKKWLSQNQKLVGIDYFKPTDACSDDADV